MIVEKRFKDFIERQMMMLADYDSLRPKGHVYEFHLHSNRVALSMKQLAKSLGYNDDMANALYWATRPHDIGKMRMPVKIWDTGKKPSDELKEIRREHALLSAEIFRDEFGEECKTDPFLRLLIDLAEKHHETLDGNGFLGLEAQDLSREVRMICICDAFDGWSVKREHFNDRDLSAKAVLKRMKTEKAGQFDTEILKSFEKVVLCQSKSFSLLL